MSISAQVDERAVIIPFRLHGSRSRGGRSRGGREGLQLESTLGKSSAHEVLVECRQIRNEWSCEEERRRRRLADVMQVRLLDSLTS